MMPARLFETILVVLLFLGYVVLWRLKRASQMRSTAIDPDVLSRAQQPIQAYFGHATKVITGVVVLLIVLHALPLDTAAPLERMSALEALWWDVAGLALGTLGLALCAVAQRTMGESWRVGIDVEHRTALVTGGLYRWVRNPTYTGLFMVHAALWLIWPTWAVISHGVIFFVLMEMQVRCEEEFLERLHGEAYLDYKASTKRYVPGVY